MAFCDNNNTAITSTAYGEVRTYDMRGPRRATGNFTVLEEHLIGSQLKMLTNIVQSQKNEHLLYAVSQEGTPIVIDRRLDCRVIRKMPGAKGRVRDAKVLALENKDAESSEFLFTVGCDRHMRIFDASE